jgi:hypothetical protein
LRILRSFASLRMTSGSFFHRRKRGSRGNFCRPLAAQ